MMNPERLQDVLGDRFRLRVEPPDVELREYYDTFDWLAYGNELILYRSGNQYSLHMCDKGGRVLRADTDTVVEFADELPDGPLKKAVQSAIEVRALMPKANVAVRRQTSRVLNEDEKTVARIVQIALTPSDEDSESAPESYLSLQSVRGYGKIGKRLTAILGELPEFIGDSEDIELQIFEAAMASADQVPGSYSSKLSLSLTPDMRSDEAAKVIVRQLLAIMRANEDGIRNDTDSEFLHDYRVAIRRTRSALSQINGVFPTDVTDRYKSAFRELGQATNALRDLDVYLLAESEYRALLPESLQDDIGPLFAYLHAQRARALVAAVRSMDAPETKRMLAEWESFISEPHSPSSRPGPGAINATTPILVLSQQRIYSRYARILKSGKPLLQDPEDEKLHSLRIDCKKLRYLLEFFASLYPPKKVRRLIRELRYLQENLGEANDLSVQQEYLMSVARELPLDDPSSVPALVATGALVESLARRQSQVTGEFSERFIAFASEKNRQLYQELFTVSVSYTDNG